MRLGASENAGQAFSTPRLRSICYTILLWCWSIRERKFYAILHFGSSFFHESLNTQMDCRGFKDVAQMNAYMIKQWNSRVRTRDEVVILGDFSVGKAEQTNEILNQLNGRLYMIKGNHDRYLKESEFNKERFVWIKPYAEMHDNRRKVVLSHYPIFCYNGQYRRNKKANHSPTCSTVTYMIHSMNSLCGNSARLQDRQKNREIRWRTSADSL